MLGFIDILILTVEADEVPNFEDECFLGHGSRTLVDDFVFSKRQQVLVIQGILNVFVHKKYSRVHLEFTFDLHLFHQEKILAGIEESGLLSICFAIKTHKQEEIVQIEHPLDQKYFGPYTMILLEGDHGAHRVCSVSGVLKI